LASRHANMLLAGPASRELKAFRHNQMRLGDLGYRGRRLLGVLMAALNDVSRTQAGEGGEKFLHFQCPVFPLPLR